MKYTKAQFLKDVAAEAKALKKNATKEELGKLNFDDLNPRNYQSCIYGQMTGDCRSGRASQLIFGCCKRYCELMAEGNLVAANDSDDGNFRHLSKNINGVKPDGINSARELTKNRANSFDFYSLLESYIMLKEAKLKNLIAYLRGERKDLVL